VTLCAVCTVHMKMRIAGFLIEPQNQGRRFVFSLKTTGMVCQWFGLKTTGTVFSGLTSKPAMMIFSGLTSKLVVTVSLDLISKSVAQVSRFGLQNRW
jgi:hypothetical protein